MDDRDNPWLAVPSKLPYWLPCDTKKIREYNAQPPAEKYLLRENVLPEPFIGRAGAPVVLLNLNPGFVDRDPDDHAHLEFQLLLRKNYEHSHSDFPFYSLNPGFENGGRTWWEGKLKCLLTRFGPDQLSRQILCIEYFPYHSRRFDRSTRSGHAGLELPSQKYGFYLASQAIEQNAFIVIMRAEARWIEKVEGLVTYPRKCTLNSVQNPAISPRNCARYDDIVSAIAGGNAL